MSLGVVAMTEFFRSFATANGLGSTEGLIGDHWKTDGLILSL